MEKRNARGPIGLTDVGDSSTPPAAAPLMATEARASYVKAFASLAQREPPVVVTPPP